MNTPCLEQGCPNMAKTQGRCIEHYRARQRQRNAKPSRQANYGADHSRWRAALAASLPAECAYCGGMIYRGDKWVAAHVRDGDPTSERVVAHARCNENAKIRTVKSPAEAGRYKAVR